METALPTAPEHSHIMERLESLKKKTDTGVEYWLAREIGTVLGYPTWAKFFDVVKRAQAACDASGFSVENHFSQTGKVMEVGKGGSVRGVDFFLTRYAAYLIAMNGDAGKVEVAAAQTYFAIQTRRMELEDAAAADDRRLELRDKATTSFKKVSQQAQASGVRNIKQAVFHDQRYLGLYGRSAREVKLAKGLADDDNLFDHAGPLELSAHDFQMNLAADVLANEGVKHEAVAIAKNREVAQRVRRTMIEAKATMPEVLPLEGHIQEVRKRVTARNQPKRIT